MSAMVRARRYADRRLVASGFTLIELLVTLVVVGILAAIAIPNFATALRKVKRAAAYQSMREVDKSIQKYMLEYDEPPPSLDTIDMHEFVDAKILDSRTAEQLLRPLEDNQLIAYFSWAGWGGSDYWYVLIFRPKGEDAGTTCYLLPDGLWQWEPIDGWQQVQ